MLCHYSLREVFFLPHISIVRHRGLDWKDKDWNKNWKWDQGDEADSHAIDWKHWISPNLNRCVGWHHLRRKNDPLPPSDHMSLEKPQPFNQILLQLSCITYKISLSFTKITRCCQPEFPDKHKRTIILRKETNTFSKTIYSNYLTTLNNC